MQIRSFLRGFEAVKYKFQPLEGIRTIRMEILAIRMLIRTIWKGFKALESKFKPLERDSKHSNAHSNHSKGIRSIRMQILTIQKGFEAIKCKFEPLERDAKHSNPNSNHSKGHSNASSKFSNGLWGFRIQILTIRKGFETFESKFKPLERDSKHSNANCNLLKGIRSIRMQIP